MPARSRSDIPRLSGRPGSATPPDTPREPARVFRRFFDLLERLERPYASHTAAPAAKSERTPDRGGRR